MLGIVLKRHVNGFWRIYRVVQPILEHSHHTQKELCSSRSSLPHFPPPDRPTITTNPFAVSGGVRLSQTAAGGRLLGHVAFCAWRPHPARRSPRSVASPAVWLCHTPTRTDVWAVAVFCYYGKHFKILCKHVLSLVWVSTQERSLWVAR